MCSSDLACSFNLYVRRVFKHLCALPRKESVCVSSRLISKKEVVVRAGNSAGLICSFLRQNSGGHKPCPGIRPATIGSQKDKAGGDGS